MANIKLVTVSTLLTNTTELFTVSSSSHSQSMVNIRRGNHSIRGQVERSHQIMNVNKGLEFGHLFRFDDTAADP